MGDIAIPPSLSSETATLALIESLQKLLNPVEYQKVKQEVVSHHALNEIESKKYADAKTMIKDHQNILDETKRIADKTELDKKDLERRDGELKQKCIDEGLKIADEWAKISSSSDEARELHSKAESMINSMADRESALKKNQDQYNNDIAQLKIDQDTLVKDRNAVEKFKSEVIAMDNQTKAKVEKLKQFNF